jgi:hypothetical protein
MAYLAYNFPNADSARTLAGAADDLMIRWAKGSPRTLFDLKPLLTDAQCATCASRSYFHAGAAQLPTLDRLNLIHHYWRAANFVNNPTLAERQFGFSTFSGFSPATHQSAWQDFDGTATDDIVALPAILKLGTRQLTRDTTLSGLRSFRGATFPMTLAPFSANYWVIRSDAAVQTANRDLVIRIIPTACYDCRAPSHTGFALLASAVGYSIADTTGDESILWQSPQAASFASPVQSIETDSPAGAMELVVPNFGLTNRSVALVLSVGDDQAGSYAQNAEQRYVEAIPYRLEVGMRTSPYQATNPLPVGSLPNYAETALGWAPGNDEIVYSGNDLAVPPPSFQIYRKKLDGSPPVAIGQQALMQRTPAWSPRGDAIAYEGAVIGSLASNIWIADLNAGGAATLRQLTSLPGCASMPSFQPDGQGLVYTYLPNPNDPAPICYLRWVGLSGAGSQLAVLGNVNNFGRRPRWSPDGKFIYVSLAGQGDRIHAIPRAGGTPTLVSSIPTPTLAFDLHPGSGRVVLESSEPVVNTAFLECQSGTPASKPATRIALLDTTVSPSDLGYRVSDRVLLSRNPAYAPNGITVAYETNVAGSLNTDIVVR